MTKETNKLVINSAEFKKEMENIIKDYIDVKKSATELGYDKEVFKFKDYVDYYIRLNKK